MDCRSGTRVLRFQVIGYARISTIDLPIQTCHLRCEPPRERSVNSASRLRPLRKAAKGFRMTAVYAYAQDNVVFVGGDSCRTDRRGVRVPACKLYHWSDSVLFAQAGEAQFLTQLIGKVLPLMGFYPPTDEGFFDAFAQLNGRFWSEAEQYYTARKAGSVPAGTILAVATATSSTSARIHRVDFRTGLPTLSNQLLEADGAAAAQFTSDAQRHFLALRAASSNNGVPLDKWAALCVSDAATSHPGVVNYPTDALIGRPSTAGDRVLVQRRMHSATAPPIALFELP